MRKPVAEGSLRSPYTFIHHSLRTDLFVESGFDRFSLSDAKMVGRAHPNGVVFVVLVVVCFRPHGKLAVHIQCRCFRLFFLLSPNVRMINWRDSAFFSWIIGLMLLFLQTDNTNILDYEFAE